MKTILVPLDGSSLSRQAVPYARSLAQAYQARILLLRVIPDIERENLVAESLMTMYVGEASSSYEERDLRAIRDLTDHALGFLQSVAEPIRMDGLEVELVVRIGPPAELITEVAAANEATTIVMATHGYSGIQRWALGSVADKVVHAAKMPVLLIRGTNELPEVPAIRQIMVPLDGSAMANKALETAVSVAQAAKANLELIHAVDPLVESYPSTRAIGYSVAHPDKLLQEMVTDVELHLNEVAKQVATDQTKVSTMTLIGYPAEVIVDEAERRHADLIVMATHGYSGLRRWALGSVADKVLHSTRTPLMLVRVND